MAVYRDRIKELRWVRHDELARNPKNWRKHPAAQREAINEILQKVGVANALLARETRDGLELIDGHLRHETLAEQEIPVIVLDVDEKESALLLASLDPIASMAMTSEHELQQLLKEVSFDDGALGQLLEELAGPTEEELDEEKILPRSLTEPADMAWVLIGIPLRQYGRISDAVELIALNPQVIVETTVNNHENG